MKSRGKRGLLRFTVRALHLSDRLGLLKPGGLGGVAALFGPGRGAAGGEGVAGSEERRKSGSLTRTKRGFGMTKQQIRFGRCVEHRGQRKERV
jgi:hypothetical protein